MMCEEHIDLLLIPRGIAKLERVAMMLGQRSEEISQAIKVEFPVCRQLEQNGTKLVHEHVYRVKEFFEPLLRVFQLLHVCQEAAALRCETKSLRRRIFPIFQPSLGGQAIERVVQLNR